MSVNVHDRIKSLIEDTNDAYFACGTMNADFAEFASMALAEFKTALRNPSLTRSELMNILRTGGQAHKAGDPSACWATFMARHIAKSANSNRRVHS